MAHDGAEAVGHKNNIPPSQAAVELKLLETSDTVSKQSTISREFQISAMVKIARERGWRNGVGI